MSPALLTRLTREVALGLTDLSPSGCECAFVPFGRWFGIKCYTRQHVRDFAFRVQRHAAWAGLGPWAYLTFDCPDPRPTSCRLYCYVTRRVKTVTRRTYEDRLDERLRLDQRAALVLGGTHYDGKPANYGLDALDRLVILDFGRLSGLGGKVVRA